MDRHSTRGRDLALASLLYTLLTFVLAWPLSAHPATRVLWLGADTPLFAWTLAWDVHALAHGPLSIFDANIFHPQRLTLAYSENLIGSAPFAAPAIWLGNPVLAINLVSLLSCVLCGLGAFVLARRLGVGTAGALLAGFVFAFSPPRFGRLAQLHLATIQWLPFTLAALHRYLDEGRPRDARIAAAFFTAQVLTSGHGAVFTIVAAAALVAWRVALGEPAAPLRRLRDLGIPGALLLLPSVLLILPYVMVQREVGLRRPLDPAWWTDWWPAAISFAASPAHVPRRIASWFVNSDTLPQPRAFLFPGFVPLLLAAVLLVRSRRGAAGEPGVTGVARERLPAAVASWIGASALVVAGTTSLLVAEHVAFGDRITLSLESGTVVRVHSPWRPAAAGVALLALGAVLAVRRWRSGGWSLRRVTEALAGWRATHRRNAVLFYSLLMAAGVWLSMGAPLGPWPVLYDLPGFNFIRVPSRFSLLALLGLGVLAGFGFDRLASRLAPRRRTAAAVVIGLAMVAESAMVPLAAVPYGIDVPAVDRWLDTQPKPFVVAEVPFSEERDQAAYMLHSTAHWQRTVAGYSGIRPQSNEDANQAIRTFPARRSLEAMASLGVTYLVVHTDAYRPGQWPVIEREIAATSDWLTLVHAEGAGRVYMLRAPKRTP